MCSSAPGSAVARVRPSLAALAVRGVLPGLVAAVLVASTGCYQGAVEYDLDGDGALDSVDCGPSDPTIFPGAEDVVDDAGIDNDCDGSDGVDADGDGVPSEGSGGDDCNDDEAIVHPGAEEIPDDGHDNDCAGGDASCDGDGDGVLAPLCGGVDCDDSNSLFFPGAAELCDGLDGDCDGAVPSCELDADGDGLRGCEGDCDDGAPEVGPGQEEVCDGRDTNCDGTLPADELDGDGDGVSPCAGDCDDADPQRLPGADEGCDGLDTDCDGALPADEFDEDADGDPACSDCDDADGQRENLDLDGDGWTTCAGDCDDLELGVYPGGVDAWGDLVDGNCDLADGLDADGDGHAANGVPPDCNDDDTDAGAGSTWPGAPDAAGDGADQDCDGVDGVDADGDGVASTTSGGDDCNDDPADPLASVTFPGADDSAGNGVDTDCDGVDGIDADGDEVASLGSGGADCNDDPDDPQAASTRPGAADTVGDGVDQDCDGVDGVDADGDGVASTATGGLDCNDDPADPLAPTTLPGADDQVGNGVDTDCDGVDGIDDDGDGVPSLGSGGDDCNDDPDDPAAFSTRPGAPDVAGDDVDQDCDGVDGVDADGDGVASEASGGEDCLDDPANPLAPTSFPGAGDLWGDADDTNCDGVDGLDADGDGWAANAGDGSPDCNDSDPGVYPGNDDGWESPAVGLDRNCDGGVFDVVDEAQAAFVGEAGGDWSGWSLAAAGDVDGDGLDDLLIGAYGSDRSFNKAGTTYLIYGSTIVQGGTADLSQADVALFGQSSYDNSGNPVASAGDVDGDGLDDLLIGAPYGDTAVSNAGRAYLVLASSLPTSGTLSLDGADTILLGEARNDNAGHSVAPAGDVDGDGLDDVLVGAPNNDQGGNRAGKVYLVLGSQTSSGGDMSLAGAHASFIGENPEERAGWSVAAAGDVDGDGLDDVLMGAPSNSQEVDEAGRSYLWFGSTIAGGGTFDLEDADASMLGEADGDRSGDWLSTAGDVDGDGLDDVLVGSQHNSDVGLFGGKAYLVLGSTLAAGGAHYLADAHASFLPEAAGDYAGVPVAPAGDVDGDGLADVLIAARRAAGGMGTVYLMLGASISVGGVFDLALADAAFVGEAADNQLGTSAAAADVDGDGLSDILLGAYGNHEGGNYAGKTYVMLSPY